MFLSLYAMNQSYGWLRCMEALAIIRMKMIVSVVQNIDTFFLIRQKLRLAFCPHQSIIFLFLKHVLKTFEVR